MKKIKAQPVQIGKFYRTTEDAFGINLPLVIYFIDYPAIPGNQTDEPEPAKIEINSVFILRGDEFLFVEPSESWVEDMQTEILESLCE